MYDVYLVFYRTEDALGELLREIERHSSSVRYEAMANILAIHCQSEGEYTDLVITPIRERIRLRSFYNVCSYYQRKAWDETSLIFSPHIKRKVWI